MNIKYKYMDYKFTIFERSDKYCLDFYHNKKRIKRSTKLSISKENLQIVKKQIIPELVEVLTGKVNTIQTKDYTLDTFAVDYFELHKNSVREHTYSRNVKHYKNHILPYFKNRRIESILPLELEKWQNKLLDKYAALTVQKYRSILFSIFDKAEQNDIIEKNPLTKVKAPKIQKDLFQDDEEEINPFTQTEMDIIIKNSNGYMKNFILSMASTGIRPGELISLYWTDIDFKNKTININKTTVNGVIGYVKTKSSIRKVDMLPNAEKALKLQYILTKNYQTVFINSRKNHFYSHDIINLNLRKILIESKIDIRPLYNLRHTFASQMISKGVDITWVSKMLGHKDISITLKIYTKYIKEDNSIRLKKLSQISNIIKKGN